LPQSFAWERFATEERKVGWDGYLSYDVVMYGLPAQPPMAGSVVQVREGHVVALGKLMKDRRNSFPFHLLCFQTRGSL